MDRSTGESRAAPLGNRPGLDGVRGIAVLAVVAFHGGAGADGGALGVDLFLVLSGFLITTLLIADLTHSGGVDLRRFWGRRARRLLPALLSVVVAVVALTSLRPTFGAGYSPTSLRGDALATLGYVANWRYATAGTDYFAAFAAPSPLRHTWSLAVEEQWYLLWPLAFWLLWRATTPRVGRLLAAIGALTLASVTAMWLLAGDVDRAHYGTDTRAHGLLVGAGLAVLVHRRAVETWSRRAAGRVQLAGWVGLAVALWMIVAVGGTTPWLYRGGHLLFAVASAAVVAAVLEPGRALTRAVSLRPLRAIGLISYGLYLWHWPLFIWLDPHGTGLDRWPLFGVRVVASLIAATLSYWIVEQPIRRQRIRIRRPVRVGLAATVVSALAVIVLAVPAIRDGEGAEASPVPTLPEGFEVDGSSEVLESVEGPLPPPTPAPDDGSFDVGIIGDSIGFALFWGYHAPETVPDGSGRHLTIDNASLMGCGIDPAALVVDGQPVKIEGSPLPCADAVHLWVEDLRDGVPDVVLVTLGAWEVYDRELDDGTRLRVGTEAWREWLLDRVEAVIDRLAVEAPQAAFAILDVPCFDEREDSLGGPNSFRNDEARVADVNEVLRTFAERNPARVQLLPMSEWVCPGGDPVAAIDGIPLRPDGVHVSGPAVDLFWQQRLLPELLARYGP